MATKAVSAQAEAAKGGAAARNNANADLLAPVTDPATGAGVTSLTKAHFTVTDHFGVPGQK